MILIKDIKITGTPPPKGKNIRNNKKMIARINQLLGEKIDK